MLTASRGVSQCAQWLYTSVSSLEDGGPRVGELRDSALECFHCEARTVSLHKPHHVRRGKGPRVVTVDKKMMVVVSSADTYREVTTCQELS